MPSVAKGGLVWLKLDNSIMIRQESIYSKMHIVVLVPSVAKDGLASAKIALFDEPDMN